MKEIEDLSPNFSKKKRAKKNIKFVIIHYTGMQSEIESLKRLKNKNSKVSCHYFISRGGTVIKMVDESKVAWHAGKSKWKKFKNLNKTSIGIELVNKGHDYGYEKFSNYQIKSLITLCKRLKRKYNLKSQNFLGHSYIAPLRKVDPGEKFPWKKLSKFNLGKWYKTHKFKTETIRQNNVEKIFFKNLSILGYRYFRINLRDKITDKLIIKAFQRRYNPKRVTGKIDKKTLGISQYLIKKY